MQCQCVNYCGKKSITGRIIFIYLLCYRITLCEEDVEIWTKAVHILTRCWLFMRRWKWLWENTKSRKAQHLLEMLMSSDSGLHLLALESWTTVELPGTHSRFLDPVGFMSTRDDSRKCKKEKESFKVACSPGQLTISAEQVMWELRFFCFAPCILPGVGTGWAFIACT